MPLSTTSASVSRTSATASSTPSAVRVTPVAAACASRAARLLPAASPTSSNRSGFAAMTSSAWTPIDPVEPRTMTRRMALNLVPETGSGAFGGQDVDQEHQGLTAQRVSLGIGAVAVLRRDHDDDRRADLLPDERGARSPG